MTVCFSHDTAFAFWTSCGVPFGSLTTPIPSSALWSGPPERVENATILSAVAAIPELSHLDGPSHVLVPNKATQFAHEQVKRHRLNFESFSNTFYRLHVPDLPVQTIATVSPELCMVELAQRLTIPRLVKSLYMLCGTYGPRTDNRMLLGQRLARSTPGRISGFAERHSNLRGSVDLRTALHFVASGSASPRETALAMLLCLPAKYGGYGLDLPHLNHRVEIPSWARKETVNSHLVCDLYWPNARLALEYDSTEWHSTAEKLEADSQRRAILTLLGIEVVSVTRRQLFNEDETRTLARIVGRRLGKRVRPRSKDFKLANEELRGLLLRQK